MSSSFNCEICNTAILDMPYKGQITFCPHYPPEKEKLKKYNEGVQKLKELFGIE